MRRNLEDGRTRYTYESQAANVLTYEKEPDYAAGGGTGIRGGYDGNLRRVMEGYSDTGRFSSRGGSETDVVEPPKHVQGGECGDLIALLFFHQYTFLIRGEWE